MTTRQASEYTKRIDPAGKGFSITYLGRMAQSGRIKGAHKVETGPVPYWVFDQAGLDEFLSMRRSRQPKAASGI